RVLFRSRRSAIAAQTLRSTYMIIATPSISGSAISRMPQIVATNHAHSWFMPIDWKNAVTESAPPSAQAEPVEAHAGQPDLAQPPARALRQAQGERSS